MIALHVGTIDLLDIAQLHFLQIQQIEVSILVPDMETAILTHSKEQVSTIGRNTGKGSTLIHRLGIEHQFLWSKGLRLRIE